MSNRLYDCLAVGSGPAGSILARKLAEKGKQVLLFDSHRFPRWKPCGGAIRRHLEEEIGIRLADVIDTEIHNTRLSFRGETPFDISPEDYSFPLVNRDRFDELLLRKAVEAGAEFRPGCRIVSVQEEPGGVSAVNHRGETYRGRFLAGADGANSIVRKTEGFAARGRRGFTISAKLDLPGMDLKTAFFEFGPSVGGYAWIFPKLGYCDVGITGLSWDGKKLSESLRTFLAGHDMSERGRNAGIRGHPIPYFYGLRKLNTNRILLLGDAASLVDPLTGEGIQYAVQSAIFGSEAIHTALEEGKNRITGYQDNINRRIGRELTAALEMARYYRKYPALCYNIFRRSDQVKDFLIRFLSGHLNYADSLKALRGSIPLRILFTFLWLKKAFRHHKVQA